MVRVPLPHCVPCSTGVRKSNAEARARGRRPLSAEITDPILVAIQRIKQRSDRPQQLLITRTPIRIAGGARPAQGRLRLRLQGLHRLDVLSRRERGNLPCSVVDLNSNV